GCVERERRVESAARLARSGEYRCAQRAGNRWQCAAAGWRWAFAASGAGARCCAGAVATRFVVLAKAFAFVIPAEARIQLFVLVALRETRLTSVCVSSTIPGRRLLSFACPKESNQRKRHPRRRALACGEGSLRANGFGLTGHPWPVAESARSIAPTACG